MKYAMKNVSAWIVSAAMLLGTLLPISNASAWGRFDGGHHPGYGGGWARPQPVIVHNTYVRGGGGGCVGCGVGVAAVAGLVGGVIIGTAIANSRPPTTIIEQAPPQTVVVVQGPPIGSEVASLPPSCQQMNVNGNNFYQCGPTWYKPYFGGNGVYYAVVQSP